VLTLPDFCDIGRIRGLLRTIEDKHVILNLLEKISDTDGTQVLIGSENPLYELKQFSFVAAPYCEGNRPIGAIAIIGPTRMNYAQAITLVDMTAKFITDIFSYSR
jgi:heat-inducible transcriptional repressor